MGDKDVLHVGGVPAGLGVEIGTTALQSSSFKNHKHCLSQFIHVHRELVGIPSVLVVAPVGVDGAQHSCIRRTLQVMFKGMAGQRGMINFDIQFEILVEAVGTQESYHSLRVVVVLMLGGLHRLGLDEECTFETFRSCIVACLAQHHGQVLLLPLHVGVEQGHISFTSSPEDIIFAPQCDGCIQGILYLRGGKGHTVEVGIGGGPVHVALVAEHVGGAPEQLDTGICHFLLYIGHDGFEVALILLQRISRIHQVHIVKAEIFNSDLLHKFKAGIDFLFGSFNHIVPIIPVEILALCSKRIAGFCAKGVPVCHCKFEPLFHLTTVNHLFRVIVAECQRIGTFLAFKFDLPYSGKIFFYIVLGFHEFINSIILSFTVLYE